MQLEFQTDDKLQIASAASSRSDGRGCPSSVAHHSNGASSGSYRPPDLERKLAEGARPQPLEVSILQAVSYADVFDFPLTAAEIHHNLVGISATETEVRTALTESTLLSRYLERHDSYYTLPARESNIAVRRQRAAASAELWPQATHYGQMIARLPFVRMVAVTGALAVNNARPGDDIDYLIVTEPGRLWLSRAFVILLVKRAARQGAIICPNYFLSERALALPEQDLFTAHELLQMVPITGGGLYRQLLALNDWAADYLPNAWASSANDSIASAGNDPVKRLLEGLLRTPPGDWLERWEMARKIAKFSRLPSRPLAPPRMQSEGPSSQKAWRQALVEACFSADRCKGHFHAHGKRTLEAYAAQLEGWATEE